MKILINEDGITNIDGSTYPEIENKGLFSGSNIQITLADQTAIGETITTGTLTFRAKAPSGIDYEAIITANSIDCAAPQTLTIESAALASLECTAAGVDATGDKIFLSIVSYQP